MCVKKHILTDIIFFIFVPLKWRRKNGLKLQRCCRNKGADAFVHDHAWAVAELWESMEGYQSLEVTVLPRAKKRKSPTIKINNDEQVQQTPNLTVV